MQFIREQVNKKTIVSTYDTNYRFYRPKCFKKVLGFGP
jgi:hypothetical protein